jgi:sulfate adenylyltransferase
MNAINRQPPAGFLADRLLLTADRRAEAIREAGTLQRLVLNPLSISDLEMLAVGAFSPLTGFLKHADYERVVTEMRLVDGNVWSMPITLPVDRMFAANLKEGQRIVLQEPDGHLLAIMTVEDKYGYDRRREAREVFRTEDDQHPGVARLYRQGEILLGGFIEAIDLPDHRPFMDIRRTPSETRSIFADRGWKTVVGFQTRNPIHRSHEYLQKVALEMVDGLLVHPLVGDTKSDDIPADIRMMSYRILLDEYYPADRAVLSVFPAAMRYAGPREAILHAICRRNYGCTHFIIGRDHAGVGNYYGAYDAQGIFANFTPRELGITPLFFGDTFYCKKCVGIASSKTCPHDSSHHLILSGTEVRRRLSAGEPLPAEFTRPEVGRALIDGLCAKRKRE